MPGRIGGQGVSTRYRLSAAIDADEELRDSRGRVIDETYVRDAVLDALTQVGGRDSRTLSEPESATAEPSDPGHPPNRC